MQWNSDLMSTMLLQLDYATSSFRCAWTFTFISFTATTVSHCHHRWSPFHHCIARACSHDDKCAYYTWWNQDGVCELADTSCTLHPDLIPGAETYAKYGRNYLASAIVRVTPGTTAHLDVGGQQVINVTIPVQGAGVRVVVISDPCFSGRWVGCKYGLQWDTYNRTVSPPHPAPLPPQRIISWAMNVHLSI